jgi:hypothetical protein
VTARLAREATTAAYHLRAEEAAAQAEASSLDRVREKHEIAATRWRALAALSEAGGFPASAWGRRPSNDHFAPHG